MVKIDKKTNNVILICFMFIIMAVMAGAENLINIFIPLFKQDFALDNSMVGTIVSMGSFAYLVFTFIGGILSEKFGQKKVFIIGLSTMVISLILYRTVDSYFTLLLNVGLMNIGISLISIAINTVIPVMVISFQAIIMSMTHFFYGAGSASGQAIGNALYSRGENWQSIYSIFAIVMFIILVAFIFVRVPSIEVNDNREKISFKNMFRNKLVYFYIFGLGFYVIAEMGTVRWLTNYIVDTYAYSQSKSGMYITLFTIIFSIGRLLGGFIVEKLGYLNSIVKSLMIGTVLYTLGLILGAKGLVLLSASGLFLAITYPIVLVSMSGVFKRNTASITGVVVTCATTINMLGQMLIGRLSDTVGTHSALFVVPVCLVISIIFLTLIKKEDRRKFN